MTRTVFCKKYQEELEGLPQPPMPGPKGKEIYETISRKAWSEWTEQQTMLINEKQLSMMDPEARKYISEQMDKYFAGDDFDKAEGYVAPTE